MDHFMGHLRVLFYHLGAWQPQSTLRFVTLISGQDILQKFTFCAQPNKVKWVWNGCINND